MTRKMSPSERRNIQRQLKSAKKLFDKSFKQQMKLEKKMSNVRKDIATAIKIRKKIIRVQKSQFV